MVELSVVVRVGFIDFVAVVELSVVVGVGFIDFVAVVELSIVVGVGYAAVVETVVVGLTTVDEALRPSVAELERVSDTLWLVDISPCSFTAPILMIFYTC